MALAKLEALPTPALLLDLDVVENNLRAMQARATRLGVALRPHVKTHKCVELARQQRALGAKGLTVSTIAEARALVDAGFDDLTWALPNPIAHVDALLALAHRATLRVLVDDLATTRVLDERATHAGVVLPTWIEVDSGQHRSGLDPRAPDVAALVRFVSTARGLALDGLLTHAGQSYGARSRDALRAIARHERDVMVELARRLRAEGLEPGKLSIGSTPTMSVAEDLTGIDEIRPGNYVFHDLTQVALGSCALADCGVTVLASVISHPPGASHFVTDAGALALSKDPGPVGHLSHRPGMGAVLADHAGLAIDASVWVDTLSQEHGVVAAESAAQLAGRFRVGSRVRILEHHSCLTAAQFDAYHVVRGDDVVDVWPIHRARA
jgi:D-serine deaminase-like pyridoxal phosphate-dependent protein